MTTTWIIFTHRFFVLFILTTQTLYDTFKNVSSCYAVFLYISFLYEIGFCFFLSGFYYYLSIYYYSVKLKTNQIIISKAIIDISTNVVH